MRAKTLKVLGAKRVNIYSYNNVTY